MKKMLLILLALVVIFLAGAGGYFLAQPRQAEPSFPETTPLPTPTPTLDPADALVTPEVPGVQAEDASMVVDLDALCAQYAPESVYAKAGDREITWADYCQWMRAYVSTLEDSMIYRAAYGQPFGWTSLYDGSTYAELAVTAADNRLCSLAALERFAAENGVSVSDEEVASYADEEIRNALGEEASAEDRAALLAENFLTEELFLVQVRAGILADRLCETLYGTAGEKLGEEELQRYVEEQGYLRCNHILFKTVDDDFSPLDDETVAAQKAAAEALAAELQAIDDQTELLAIFAQRKADLDEDPGKVSYPDGYLFQPGRMVAVFEDTTKALQPYEVSDPVLSEYGYHVILRLPISVETPTDDGGTIGAEAANAALSARLNEITESDLFVLEPGFQRVDLTKYLVPAEAGTAGE